jgi:hypothetical protein
VELMRLARAIAGGACPSFERNLEIILILGF